MKIIAAFIATILSAVLLGYYASTFITLYPQGYADILVAPSGSEVNLDGKRSTAGKHKLPIGKHTASITKNGFKPLTQSFEIKEGQTITVAGVLESEEENWYEEHPDQSRLAESIQSQLNDNQAENETEKNLLINELPFISGGFVFEINTGRPLVDTGQSAIYITAKSPEARKLALKWIRAGGYDPADMDIVFQNQAEFEETIGVK